MKEDIMGRSRIVTMFKFFYTPRFAISVLFCINLVTLTAGGYLYLIHKEEVQLRVSVETLVDRLAGELVATHEELGNAQFMLEEADRRVLAESQKNISLLEEIAAKDRRIEEMAFELAELRPQSDSIDLGDVYVMKGTVGPPGMHAPRQPQNPAAAPGTVLAVNMEFNFVIVNMGSNEGIRKGMVLTHAGPHNRSVSLRVDMVDKTTCAATIEPGSQNDIQIGDRVNVGLT